MIHLIKFINNLRVKTGIKTIDAILEFLPIFMLPQRNTIVFSPTLVSSSAHLLFSFFCFLLHTCTQYASMKSDEIIKLLLPVKSIFHLQLQEILQPIITIDYSVFNNKILHGRINNTLIYIECKLKMVSKKGLYILMHHARQWRLALIN